MAVVSGSAGELADHLIRIEVGHLVSSSSMVSRAYLSDTCRGVIVDSSSGGLWLVSALPALAPDSDGLRERAADTGGIPVEHGTPRLVKITLAWGDGSIDLANPAVVSGPGVGAVSLAVPASFGDRIRAGDGPRPVDMSAEAQLRLGDEVGIVVMADGGPIVKWARVASDPGFGGHTGALALDASLSVDLAGSPVFDFGESTPLFCGLAQPLDDMASILLPPEVIAEVVDV